MYLMLQRGNLAKHCKSRSPNLIAKVREPETGEDHCWICGELGHLKRSCLKNSRYQYQQHTVTGEPAVILNYSTPFTVPHGPPPPFIRGSMCTSTGKYGPSRMPPLPFMSALAPNFPTIFWHQIGEYNFFPQT